MFSFSLSWRRTSDTLSLASSIRSAWAAKGAANATNLRRSSARSVNDSPNHCRLSAPRRGLVQGISVSWAEPSTKRSGELVPVLTGSGLQSGSEAFCLAPQTNAKKLCWAIGIPTVELGALGKILLIGVPAPLPCEGFWHRHRSRRHVTILKTTQSQGRNGEKRIELTSVCGSTNERNQKKKKKKERKKEREKKGETSLQLSGSCPLRQNVTPASGGQTRFVKTLKQSHVSELDSLPRQTQSFLDTSTKTKEHTESYTMRPKRSSRSGLASNPDMRRHKIKILSQYCRVPKNGLPKNGQAGISSKNKNDPRLEFHLKIRTTPGWKNELRTVSSHANSVCCEDDFFGGIADSETTPLRRFERFQPHSPPRMRRRVPCARYTNLRDSKTD